MEKIGWLTAIGRGLISHEMSASGIAVRHRRLVQAIWTANGMGERYYQALDPGVPYSKFENAVTDLVCRGAQEGWIRIVMPVSPLGAENQSYRLEIDDEERFVREMSELFAPPDS